jgi:antitoxin ParD1/3/4
MDHAPATRTLTVTVPEEQAEQVEDAVRSGRFATDSDVVSAALSVWEKREAIRREEIARLKQAWDEGKASGEPEDFDPDAFLAEMRAEYAGRDD